MMYTQRRALWKVLLVCALLTGLFLFAGQVSITRGDTFSIITEKNIEDFSVDEDKDSNDVILYLPVITHPVVVTLGKVWTADIYGTPREAFLPGKVIRFYGSGFDNIEDGTLVHLTWLLNGPCGESTLHSGTYKIGEGNWSFYQTALASTCTGVHTYTLKLVYEKETLIQSTPFVINKPSETAAVRLPAFDKCNIPYGSKTHSVNQMQSWWAGSPYHVVNLYIGGISRACDNTELDAVWVNLVAKQGWAFIPTWVGPQAPCSKYKYKMSPNREIAYNQGRTEAQAAVNAARDLGLEGNVVIYYDMEGYDGDLACRETVKSFLSGWGQRLHELGARSGVYGSTFKSYINDWATISPIPDNVWIASWYTNYYDPYASVWNINGLSNNLWANNQRIRQYAGDHVETWAGIAFSIDSNIVDAQVTYLPNILPGQASDTMINPLPTGGSLLQDMQLVSMGNGWALVDNRLLWSEDGGNSWQDISPDTSGAEILMSVYFMDIRRGWVAMQDSVSGQLSAHRTADGGKSWEASLIQPASPGSGPTAGKVFLEFIDPNNGWAAIKFISSSNFSVGMLFHTSDGGANWVELDLPLGEPVRFIDAQRGWVAGGPAGDELYRSDDSGRTWQRQDVIPSGVEAGLKVILGLPVFENDRNGVLPVTIAGSGSPRVEIFLTRDGGDTWEPSSTVPLDPSAVSGVPVSLAADDGSRFIMASPEDTRLYIFDSSGEASSEALPEGVVQINFSDGTGWAQINTGECSGQKGSLEGDALQCEYRSQLLKTTNGGKTWSEITPR